MATVVIVTEDNAIKLAEIPGTPAEVAEALNSERMRLPLAGQYGKAIASVQGYLVVVSLADAPAAGGLPAGLPSLTPRELQTLQWLADGLTVKQIAAHLGCSQRTVRSHVQRLSAKLGARTKEQSVAQGLALGLCRPPAAFPPQ
jgi:DNA-binding CsgD family transcriptional regulator